MSSKSRRGPQATAVEKIVAMGYTQERAERAVREYAAAAAETKSGPDWRGWLRMVRLAGLVEPDGRPSPQKATKA
ncbi:hypothetical protein [Georgenia wangjunii]|uniref:hypothetical protein n=1 Tax=Georgenia wangjunii TaxID=3117730 RepID=UPI002F269965